MPRAASSLVQFALPLDWSAAGSNDPPLVVGACNTDALRFLAHPESWPIQTSVLLGPPKSGRSLIGRLFARSSGGRVIDGLEGCDDETLFHAWNAAQSDRRPLLIIADRMPSEWPVSLADLRSRLAAVPVVRIAEPDDGYSRDYIEAQFALRGVIVGPDVADYIVRRMHRSHATLAAVVAALDRASLEQGRRVSKKLAKEVLRGAGLISDDLVDQAGATT